MCIMSEDRKREEDSIKRRLGRSSFPNVYGGITRKPKRIIKLISPPPSFSESETHIARILIANFLAILSESRDRMNRSSSSRSKIDMPSLLSLFFPLPRSGWRKSCRRRCRRHVFVCVTHTVANMKLDGLKPCGRSTRSGAMHAHARERTPERTRGELDDRSALCAALTAKSENKRYNYISRVSKNGKKKTSSARAKDNA